MAAWADQDPAAMRRLLADAELRAQVLAALDVAAPAERDRAEASRAQA
ncbi:MAG: hypothetical protein M9894_17200 [Planctomycetes bacterium]|nr:hypothetical protein [Planctomycetota bacterium]